MTNPVPGYPVSTAYKKTGTHWTTCGWHTGQDYSAPSGTSIVAARAGVVAYVSYGSSFGSHQFVIRPGDGTEDFYAHTRTRPASGITVAGGEYVAEVGAEGNATGPHLHFERHSSYGWGCSLCVDPMQSHNAGGTTPAPEEDYMANPITFFTKAGKTYEANILAGTYYWVRNEADLKDRKAILTTLGIQFTTWTPGADVANLEAFGVEVE